MKKYLVIAAIIVASNCFAETLPNFEGKYTCSGNEPGSKQGFTCEKMVQKTGETYLSMTTCSDGSDIKGTGIYDPKTQHVAFAFIDNNNANNRGIAINELKPDGSLLITFAYLNQSTVGHVTCIKK